MNIKLKNVLAVSLVLLLFFLAVGVCLFVPAGTVGETRPVTVVLDAGHGGIDAGVSGINTKVKESEVNLAIVRIVERNLKNAGINVVLTRKTGAGLYGVAVKGFKKRDMQKRKEVILSAVPAVVVSIHQNAYPASIRRGAQVFFKKGDENGETLANDVQKELNALEENPQKSVPLVGDFYMLNCSPYPSVLCECGFLSNPEDERLLLTAEYREKIALAVYKGVISYLSYATVKKSV